MQAVSLQAEERAVLGKKVKKLRAQGLIPAHVYGKGVETEHVSVPRVEFLKVFSKAGETGLIDLKIGQERTRPVLVRGVQVHPVTQSLVHIDFYQVNLKEKVQVPVPVILEGEEPELVHAGEAVVIQPLNEVEVEALPTDIPEHITVDISVLKVIGDAVHVSNLRVPEGVTVLADAEAVVVKLDTAITEEMQKLLEEQQAEQEAAAAEAAAAEGAVEGETSAEGEVGVEAAEGEAGAGEAQAESQATEDKPEQVNTEDKPQ